MAISRDIIAQTLATKYGEHAYQILETLTDAGFDTWWVGGGVRDMLMGKIPKDIDIATQALPEQIQSLFKKVDMTSAPLGSVRVTLGVDVLEVTTFREDDPNSDGRHPEAVIFGKRDTDAVRRDFTINALYFNPISKELYDPYNGEKDLEEKLIRFIEDPAVRIKHDALRILRAIRFRALIDGQYHPDTYHALRDLAQLIEPLSGQRKFEELEKLLKGPNPSRGLEDQWELGVLNHYIPELHVCKGIPQPADYHHEGDVWEHILACTRAFLPEHDIDVRIAALFHDIGKAETFSLKERIRFDEHASVSGDLAQKILSRLQCPAKRRDKIVWIVRHHMMMSTFFEITDERKAAWYFHPYFPELLQLFWLDIAGTTPSRFDLYDRILNNYHQFLDAHPRPQKPFISGDEVMELLQLPPGEKVGAILQELHDAQVRGEVTGKAEARAFIQKLAE